MQRSLQALRRHPSSDAKKYIAVIKQKKDEALRFIFLLLLYQTELRYELYTLLFLHLVINILVDHVYHDIGKTGIELCALTFFNL